ncbi:lipoamide acyltransferase component of branched-chain alpha-keto acid dehydrogenase complex, mitochondrial [Primulina huaijiensis]|uniref:lipoamide acyltransferase component of branched-chain alpha-keto acid dehydrogenase complex, mitochondrial n=1 Tax=Primulina huaijiensis TaxID=1492673 RepID=UPI003CC6F0C6
MICREIYQKNPWRCDQWWRWISSVAAPPLRVTAVEREKFLNSVSRVQDPVFANPKTKHRAKNHDKGVFLSIPFGIRWCSLTTQTMADFPVGGVVDVPLAQTGEGIAECELLKWFVQEGEEVEEFQPLCEVQSDKATIEITSRYKGKVSKVLHVPGNIVKVGETLLKMVTDENVSVFPSNEAAQNIVPQDCKINELDDDSLLKKEKIYGVLSTPAVRSFAKQLGLTIEDILGTGHDGRILKEDILNYAARKGILKESSEILNEDSSAEQYLGDKKSPDISSAYGWEYEDRSLPLRGFHRAMAKSMTLAAKIPHFQYVEEVNCDALLDLRESFKNETSDLGIKFTFLPLLVKSLSMALSRYPLLNSCFNEESQEVTLKGSHNIGIAMATSHGLVVPNIKKVQSLSIVEITKELSRLQELALSNKLSSNDVSGGTITISNIGAIGGKFGSPLVNVPEVSIIALGRIQKIPHFDKDGNLYPVSIMMINISSDHRVLDGATVARFCNEWKRFVEKPELLMLHMR